MEIFLTLKALEFISIILSAIIGGMYWGPWLALSTSMSMFDAKTFLAITHRMTKNMSTLMTVLTPAALLANLSVLFITFNFDPQTFYWTFAGFILFFIALIVTVAVEVPIVKKISTWTESTMPDNWKMLRDRWSTFHLIRVFAGVVGLGFLVAGVIF